MDLEHIQPVQSLTPDPRSRARTLIVAALPVVLLVGLVTAGILGREDDEGPGVGLVAAETADPAPAPPSAGPSATPDLAASDPSVAGFPTETIGLRVHSVDETLALRDAGKIGSEVVAVSGWLTIPRLGQCPAIGAAGTAPGASTGDGNLLCQRDTYLVDDGLPLFAIEHREGLVTLRSPGRHLRPQAMPGVELVSLAGRQFMGNSTELRPRRVVIAGRFGDPRLEECRPLTHTCEEAFAIERLVWVDGQARLRRTVRYPGLDDLELSRKVRWHIVDAANQHGSIVLSETLVPRSELRALDPTADRAVPADVVGTVWYVRTLLRSGPYGNPTGSVGWAVIEDATAAVLAADPDGRTAAAE
jgi:hypothetical protein